MSAATSAVQPPAAGTYRIDPSTSTIAFTTRHLFGTGAVKGSFDLSAGEIIVAEPITASEVAATAAADSFTTGNGLRSTIRWSGAVGHPASVDDRLTVTAAGRERFRGRDLECRWEEVAGDRT